MKRYGLTSICLSLLAIAAIGVSAFGDDKNKKSEGPKLYEKKGDKERVYNLPFEKLWAAALKTAGEDKRDRICRQRGWYLHVQKRYECGFMGIQGKRQPYTTRGQQRTRIKLTTQKTRGQLFAWGAGGRTVEKYFNALDKLLAE